MTGGCCSPGRAHTSVPNRSRRAALLWARSAGRRAPPGRRPTALFRPRGGRGGRPPGARGGRRPAGGRQPDVDLRPSGVTVCLPPVGFGGQSESDVELARRISSAARELDLPADPAGVQTVQISIDALVTEKVMPFWRAV